MEGFSEVNDRPATEGRGRRGGRGRGGGDGGDGGDGERRGGRGGGRGGDFDGERRGIFAADVAVPGQIPLRYAIRPGL